MLDKNNKPLFDEKVFSLLKKIEIPKNPFEFYFNISKIEKNLSEGLRDYFYKAINEFLHHSKNVKHNGNNNSSNFLLKIYYYTGFIKKIGVAINYLLKDVKYYDLSLYLECIYEFDKKVKEKAIYFILNYNHLNKIKSGFKNIDKNTNDFKNSHERNNMMEKEDFLIFKKFEKIFYTLDPKKNSDIIKFVYRNIKINIFKYPISYNTVKKDYATFLKEDGENYDYYKGINICLDKIVGKYNKQQKKYKENLFSKIISNFNNLKKESYIKSLVEDKRNGFEKAKFIYKEKQKKEVFNHRSDFEIFLITYLINNKQNDLKNLFYWEATKERLSENAWANIGGANIFYLQKIDENIGNFELLIFFKQFKDVLTNLYNSIFWPFIKPYFYYVLIFKSVKLTLKDWHKLFFLLMFFSAESYKEYIILQDIMKSIEKIGLWHYNESQPKTIFYIKRAFILIKEFLSSIILLGILFIGLWMFGLINIVMLGIIFFILGVHWLKYLFFPGKFEVLKTFAVISIGILGYIWFTTIFPKVTQPKYISYIGKGINSLVSLDFIGTKKHHQEMLNFIYGDEYKQNEQKLFVTTRNKILNIKEDVESNEKIKKLKENTKQAFTDILNKKDKYTELKPGTYLKYYINKEIDTLNISTQKKQEISKKTIKEYINWYCFTHNNKYCRNKLEKLPIGFTINMTKIREFINNNK